MRKPPIVVTSNEVTRKDVQSEALPELESYIGKKLIEVETGEDSIRLVFEGTTRTQKPPIIIGVLNGKLLVQVRRMERVTVIEERDIIYDITPRPYNPMEDDD